MTKQTLFHPLRVGKAGGQLGAGARVDYAALMARYPEGAPVVPFQSNEFFRSLIGPGLQREAARRYIL